MQDRAGLGLHGVQPGEGGKVTPGIEKDKVSTSASMLRLFHINIKGRSIYAQRTESII